MTYFFVVFMTMFDGNLTMTPVLKNVSLEYCEAFHEEFKKESAKAKYDDGIDLVWFGCYKKEEIAKELGRVG